jgi:PadR family transcriptional regulator PadR
VRKTQATVQVALALLDDPHCRHWGYQLSKKAGIRSGVLYPIIHRMLEEGWLTDGWESSPKGRPPRRYYEITDTGLQALGALLHGARSDARFTALARRFA